MKLALLPVYMKGKGDEIAPDRALRIRLLHNALEMSLKPLMEASWKGFEYEDGESVQRRCFPCLGNYITDIPEGKDITSTLHATKTPFTCARCLVKSQDLNRVGPFSVKKKTVADTMSVYERAQELDALAGNSTYNSNWKDY